MKTFAKGIKTSVLYPISSSKQLCSDFDTLWEALRSNSGYTLNQLIKHIYRHGFDTVKTLFGAILLCLWTFTAHTYKQSNKPHKNINEKILVFRHFLYRYNSTHTDKQFISQTFCHSSHLSANFQYSTTISAKLSKFLKCQISQQFRQKSDFFPI